MLKVIGSGLGRTGTMSTKLALEQLGFGPCHHMFEVFQNRDSFAWWVEANHGRPDWERIFAGFNAQVDHPGCQYWRELAAYYPDAKVLHTVRDPDKWFDSTQATIFSPDSPVFEKDAPYSEFFAGIARWYGGDMHDRAYMTDFFRRHTEAVKAAIPSERLLVWNVADGWAPLCAFLDVPVPAGPIPHENTTDQFLARRQARAAEPTAQ
jgi:hypothetical protein